MILDDLLFDGLGAELKRLRAEKARCGREINAAEKQEPPAPAWLATLGIEDWRREKGFIERELWGIVGIAAMIVATGVTVACCGFAP